MIYVAKIFLFEKVDPSVFRLYSHFVVLFHSGRFPLLAVFF